MLNIFKPCEKCEDGYIHSRSRKLGIVASRCQCYTAFLEKAKLAIALSKAGLSESIIDYNLDDYIGYQSIEEVAKLQKFVTKFEEKFKSFHLYLYGPNGTQKTTLAQYVGRELLKQGVSVKYVIMNEMIKTLSKEGFEEDVQTDINDYYSVDCLIIDEAFDKEKILWYKSNYQMNFLDTLLRKRIDQLSKSTIFISNKPVVSLEAEFSKSIFDLIQRNTLHTYLSFHDHYSLRNDFEPEDIWKD